MEIKKEEKKQEGPKATPSRFKITPLASDPSGQRMMFIEDSEKKIPSMAISHKDAMKKFAIQTKNVQVGGLTIPMPDPKYTDTDIELSNQVNAYLVGVNSDPKVQAPTQTVAKPTEKKKYTYSKEYYAQKRRESRMRARSDKRAAERNAELGK